MFKSLQKISSRYLTRNCCNSYYISSFSTLPKAGYDVQLDYEESVNHINDLHNGLKVIKFAAVRGLELNHPETGNWTANAIFMGSKSIDLFSVGIHPDDVEADGVPLYQRVQDIAELIEYYPEKNLLALYDGYITGTPFGMFLSSTYRLGTSKLILAIDEPTKGQIPLGGLAYKFCQYSSQYGKLVARYLFCSGALIDAETLFEIGILSNVTGPKPHLGLQYSDTLPINDTKAVQPPQGEPQYLPDMVQDIDIEEDFEDLSKYEVWNRFLRVPLQIPHLEPELGDGHLKRIFDDVEYCFSAPTVDETITRLQSIDHLFARYTLENMVKCDPFALESFYALTDFANAKRIEIESLKECGEIEENIIRRQRIGFLESLAKEIKISEMLLERQKNAKLSGNGWIPSNIPKKSEFDLSQYEDMDTEPPIDVGIKRSLKEIAEEELREKEADKKRKDDLAAGISQLRAALKSVPQEFLNEIKFSSK